MDGQWDRTIPESDTRVQGFKGNKLNRAGVCMEKEPAFFWTDDETELLLKVTLEYKVSKAASWIDWISKYADIWQLLRVQLPDSLKEAKELAKDYPHSKDEITKQVVTSKLKDIRP